LAEAFNTSAALILCSRYETFGCVQTEANACGMPVIVSEIPVFRERVRESVNGLLVSPGDPTALADAMLRIIKGDVHWDKNAIAQEIGQKYAYPVIGKMIAASYDKIVPLN
jgi:glycosyltransferase involved in cell wall biosynthesis